MPAAGTSLSAMLRSDATVPHEALPHGVPLAYDWAKAPRPRLAPPPAGFTAFTAWGQLYRCAGAPFDAKPTVELRDLQTWVLVAGNWRRVQRSSRLGGAAFAEDYGRPPVAARVASRTTRATRVRMRRGYNFHFWPGAGRIELDPSRVSALAVLARARVVGRAARDDCFTLSVGGDYWRSRTAPADVSGNATDAGIGRFKRVSRRWRAFSMTTASAETLARHPLPLRLPVSESR
jgi:hypothetical protein